MSRSIAEIRATGSAVEKVPAATSKTRCSKCTGLGKLAQFMVLFSLSIASILISTFCAPRDIHVSMAPKLDADNVAVSHAKFVYLIGSGHFQGRTNNQLMAVIRALDMMFDTHGELDMKKPNAILAVSGWARDMLKGFFFNETKHRDWGYRLEHIVPIVTRSRVGTLPGQRQILRNYSGVDFFRYKARPPQSNVSKYEILKKRRDQILGPLFSNPSDAKMKGYQSLQKHLLSMSDADDQLIPGKYMTVHSRSLEGSCLERLGSSIPDDECYMRPAYVKRLLQKVGLLGHAAVVVITDMQKKEVIHRLRSDPEIGKHVVVPALDIEGWKNDTHPATDMMVAIKSDAFAGTRVSTMAIMIGMARVATGKDAQTNLIFVDSDLNVCEECLYYCAPKMTSVCATGSNTTRPQSVDTPLTRGTINNANTTTNS